MLPIGNTTLTARNTTHPERGREGRQGDDASGPGEEREVGLVAVAAVALLPRRLPQEAEGLEAVDQVIGGAVGAPCFNFKPMLGIRSRPGRRYVSPATSRSRRASRRGTAPGRPLCRPCVDFKPIINIGAGAGGHVLLHQHNGASAWPCVGSPSQRTSHSRRAPVECASEARSGAPRGRHRIAQGEALGSRATVR